MKTNLPAPLVVFAGKDAVDDFVSSGYPLAILLEDMQVRWDKQTHPWHRFLTDVEMSQELVKICIAMALPGPTELRGSLTGLRDLGVPYGAAELIRVLWRGESSVHLCVG